MRFLTIGASLDWQEQYFNSISKEVWEYWMVAYQVAEKYLKDSRKWELSLQEIEHYINVAKVIARTIEVQGKVDEAYEGVERTK